MQVSLRGRASNLAHGGLFSELAETGVRGVEVPFLSAIAEVHDALAGPGDYRRVLQMMDSLGAVKRPLQVQVVLVPSTWNTIERTLQLLDDRGIGEIRWFPIACPDGEPSSWAISASELVAAAQWIEQSNQSRFQFTWYPPLRFDPKRTLAEQVRRGPRSAADTVRIEPDGRVIVPVGPADSAGNLLQSDWKAISRNETYRVWSRQRKVSVRCGKCPGLALCESGCLREMANWSEW